MKPSSRPVAAAAVMLSAAGIVSANAISYCPPNGNGACYKVAIPSSTASKGSGNIYFQISGPTSFSWISLGTGGMMANSNMFIMYQDGKGNLTLSPRHGTFHTTPQQDRSGTAARLTLLSGSGVSGGQMVANVMCSNCQNWNGGSLSASSSSTSWIAAWKSGNSLSSTNLNANLQQHDDTTQFQLDLTKATVTADSNPFVAGAGNSNGGGNNGGGNNGGGNNGGGNNGGGNNGGSNNGGSNNGGNNYGGGDDSSNSGVSGVKAPPSAAVLTAHGLIMALVMVVLYPLGSMLMPLLGKWLIHGVWQGVSYVLMWAGFALGVLCAQQRELLFKDPKSHTIFGTVIVAAMAIQPLLGVLHHRHFQAHHQRGLISHVHIWYGRLLMALGVVNGGLGLALAAAPSAVVVAYAVVAAVVFVAYVAAKGVGFLRRRRAARHDEKVSRSGNSSPRGGGGAHNSHAYPTAERGNVEYGQQHYSREQRRERAAQQDQQHEYGAGGYGAPAAGRQGRGRGERDRRERYRHEQEDPRRYG